MWRGVARRRSGRRFYGVVLRVGFALKIPRFRRLLDSGLSPAELIVATAGKCFASIDVDNKGMLSFAEVQAWASPQAAAPAS